MPSTRVVLREVLNDVSSSKNVISGVKSFLSKLNGLLKKKRVNARAVLGGSFAKGVWLPGDHDVDIFVKFKTPRDGLSDILGGVLLSWNPERVHGSRDYFRIVRDGFVFEIVPVLWVRSVREVMNVTDVSPLHVRWALRNLRGLRGDVRLAKLFCKSLGVYGAESYVQGFSGHVLDILIAHAGGFLPWLRSVARWHGKIVVDPENVHQGKALRVLNTSKTQGPLVVVDPVDPLRNASAVVSVESVRVLRLGARRFLRSPSKNFFKAVFHPPNKKKFFCVRGEEFNGKVDVVGARFLKVFERLREEFEDFGVKSAHWHWSPGERAWFWFSLNKRSVDSVERRGPPVKMVAHAQVFRQKHPKCVSRRGVLFSLVPPKYCTPEDVVRSVSRLFGVRLVVER